MNFSQLGLAAPLLKALDGEGYTTPTPIQVQAIPAVLAGKDLLGIAQTGTGKTAAFALPILHRLGADRRPAQRKSCHVLVLSPTRELASQIADSFRTYGRHMGVTVAVIFGGVGHRPQVQAMARGVDVLVATPGRLLDHLGENSVTLSGTGIFVLDEADQMLDLGFVKPIRQIVRHLPARRQNLFFSATMPKEIAGLADDLLHDPAKIAVAPVATTVDRVSQRVIHVEHGKKRTLLVELFSDPDMARALVFTRTKRGADRVAKHLEVAKISSAAIHGNKSQNQREAALAAFRAAKIRVLVATDIAARGIDIDAVSHVINFELPDVPEAYVHRIGRTARAGAAGSAISFCDPAERDLLRSIERLVRQSIPSENRRGDPSLAADGSVESAPERNRRDGNRSSGRPGRDSRPASGSAGAARRDSRRPDRVETVGGQSDRRTASQYNTDARPQRSAEAGQRSAARPQNGQRGTPTRGNVAPQPVRFGGREESQRSAERPQGEQRTASARSGAAPQPVKFGSRNDGQRRTERPQGEQRSPAPRGSDKSRHRPAEGGRSERQRAASRPQGGDARNGQREPDGSGGRRRGGGGGGNGQRQRSPYQPGTNA